MTIPDGPAHGDAEGGERERRAALTSWLTLAAPGILVTRAVIVLGVVTAPWAAASVHIAPGVRVTAAALLALHGVSTLVLDRVRSYATALVFAAGLAVDALLVGLLLAADLQLRSPIIALALAVAVMSLSAGGWRLGLVGVGALAVGVAVGRWVGGGSPAVASPALWPPTTLSVETAFPGASLLPASPVSFPTRLSVETEFAGVPVLFPAATFATALSVESYFGGMPAWGAPQILFAPALALALVALGAGTGASLLRGHRARKAVAAAMVAKQRAAARG